MSVTLTAFQDPTALTIAAKAVNKQPNGQFTITFADKADSVASVQPDGTLQDRPKGANGDYELCDIAGNVATFWPDRGTDKRFTKAFVLVAA